MRVVVTGAAGFIGSHLTERLLADGHTVLGIDSFTEYYDRTIKERNLAAIKSDAAFQLIEIDLSVADLPTLLSGADVVFHLAGQPGVRASWGNDFRLYLERNLWATQQLLETLRRQPVNKLVFASSSSVYGDAPRYPTSERDLPQPISPYGVTKLAGERLCLAYAASYGLPVMALRFFTVYGPRQRPDMAFSRFIESITRGVPISVFGDGGQTRDFTYVDDIVEALVRAAQVPEHGEVLNVGGGDRVALLRAIEYMSDALGRQAVLQFQENRLGDVRHTGADISRAEEILGYRPRVPLREGLRRQVDYVLTHTGDPAGSGVS